MRTRRRAGLLVTLALTALPALAQEEPLAVEGAPAPASEAPVAVVGIAVPAGTEVRLRLGADIGSKLTKRGDTFPLEVVAAVEIGGAVAIPVGARAEGEIIHAAKAGFSGRGGELIATARRVTVGEQDVKLRSFLADNGTGRTDLAAVVGISLGLPGLFIRGGNIVVPAGTEIVALVAEDTVVTSSASGSAVATTNEPTAGDAIAEGSNTTGGDSDE